MNSENDLDPEFYGPKPDAERAAALGCLLIVLTIAAAIAAGVVQWVWGYLH